LEKPSKIEPSKENNQPIVPKKAVDVDAILMKEESVVTKKTDEVKPPKKKLDVNIPKKTVESNVVKKSEPAKKDIDHDTASHISKNELERERKREALRRWNESLKKFKLSLLNR
jgi:hypothetical protein